MDNFRDITNEVSEEKSISSNNVTDYQQNKSQNKQTEEQKDNIVSFEMMVIWYIGGKEYV